MRTLPCSSLVRSEELSEDRMHLHCLLLLYLLVGPEDDSDGQREAGSRAFPTVPSRSAPAASSPTSTGEQRDGGMYLSSILSRTTGSSLNPGICMPVLSICFATSLAPCWSFLSRTSRTPSNRRS